MYGVTTGVIFTWKLRLSFSAAVDVSMCSEIDHMSAKVKQLAVTTSQACCHNETIWSICAML